MMFEAQDLVSSLMAQDATATAAPAPATATTAPTPTTGQVEQGEVDPALKGGGTPQVEPSFWESGGLIIVMMAVMLIFFIVLPGRARKKQQAKFADMLSKLKPDDRIMLQNGKFVTINKIEGERVHVYADQNKSVVEEYHKNAISMLATDVDKQPNAR